MSSIFRFIRFNLFIWKITICVHMSDRSKNIIAKEIINQTRIHFKKRRTELKTDTHTSKESFRTGNRKTEQKEKKTYNPSSNFTKIFGELTGEKSSSLNCKHAKEEKTSNVKCYPKLKNTQPEEIKINSNGKLNKTPKKETNNPPSIFQKLSQSKNKN